MKCRVWNVGGRTCNGSSAELQRGNHIGNRICQCRMSCIGNDWKYESNGYKQ